jgi:hypothetical protein
LRAQAQRQVRAVTNSRPTATHLETDLLQNPQTIRRRCSTRRRGNQLAVTKLQRRPGYLRTNVVTVVAASEALKVPLVTVTAVPAVRLALDEVTFGVHEAGAVPPAMLIGTVAADVPLLMATTTLWTFFSQF